MNVFTQEEKDYIKQLMSNSSTKWNIQRFLKKYKPEFWNKIIESTSFLDESAKTNERLYCILNDIFEPVLCKHCHSKKVKFHSSKGYSNYCSISCGTKAQMIRQGGIIYDREKIRKTRIEKYGSYHPIDFGHKVKETKLKNHGDENFVNSEKAKQTKQEKYGNEHFINYEKVCKTKEERYGNANYNNSQKISETKQAFSNDKNKEINEKRKETVKERYGVEHILQSEKIKEKIKNTCFEKYGVSNSLLLLNTRNKLIKQLKEKSYKHMLDQTKEYEPLFSYEEFESSNPNKTYFKWKHKLCGEVVLGRYVEGKILAHCRKCYPYNSSIGEKEVLKFIQSIYSGKIIENDRQTIKPKELDIYIPELKIAFEFDGLFWHSENHGTDKNAMVSKTNLCNDKGIQCIHIFEDEWLNKTEIVKSRISNLLGFSHKIYARECEIKEVQFLECKHFLENNHIQGSCSSKIRLGLYYENELVSIMSFGKSRFSKISDWELLRFCNKLNTSVIGGASRLLSYFEKTYHPKSLISYADRRWSNGKMYFKLGFEKISNGTPNYWYFGKEYIRLSRLKFQKHKLKDLLESYDSNKTEVENMNTNGYNRIFDCGNITFIKTYSK